MHLSIHKIVLGSKAGCHLSTRFPSHLHQVLIKICHLTKLGGRTQKGGWKAADLSPPSGAGISDRAPLRDNKALSGHERMHKNVRPTHSSTQAKQGPGSDGRGMGATHWTGRLACLGVLAKNLCSNFLVRTAKCDLLIS